MLTLTGSCPLSEFAAKERETRCCSGSQPKGKKREKDTRGKMAESKVLTWKQMKEKIKNQFYLSKD